MSANYCCFKVVTTITLGGLLCILRKCCSRVSFCTSTVRVSDNGFILWNHSIPLSSSLQSRKNDAGNSSIRCIFSRPAKTMVEEPDTERPCRTLSRMKYAKSRLLYFVSPTFCLKLFWQEQATVKATLSDSEPLWLKSLFIRVSEDEIL